MYEYYQPIRRELGTNLNIFSGFLSAAMESRNKRLKWLVYTFLLVAANVLDTVLSSVITNSKPRLSLEDSDIDNMSDEEILDLQAKAPKLHLDYSLQKLTPDTVAKASQDMDEDMSDASEANALSLVLANTTIPVPRVRRVVKREWDYLIIQDYIKGPTLAEVWSTYSIWQKIGVAFTLHSYIRQLRRLKAAPTTPPGPIGADGPRICESPIFGRVRSHRGPFASYAELTTFFNERAKMAYDANELPEDHPSRKQRFDNSEALVFTHQDINPRNIIVGEDGRLWIIDWGWSGYYPPWFEYLAMREQSKNEKIIGSDHKYWDLLIPFVCGPYFKQEEWLYKMSRGLNFR